jgi:hypothetical protein
MVTASRKKMRHYHNCKAAQVTLLNFAVGEGS